jgi:hypothetical protein
MGRNFNVVEIAYDRGGLAGSMADYTKNTNVCYEIQLSTGTHFYHQQLKETNSDLD